MRFLSEITPGAGYSARSGTMEDMHAEPTHETSFATVRRVPRYGVFMALGALLGIVVALILTFTGSFEESDTGVIYSTSQVLGFTLLLTIPIGVALGGVAAMLLERLTRRHDRVVAVDRETIIAVDEHPEAATDEGG